MPIDVAMKEPSPRIIREESKHEEPASRDRCCIPSERILDVRMIDDERVDRLMVAFTGCRIKRYRGLADDGKVMPVEVERMLPVIVVVERHLDDLSLIGKGDDVGAARNPLLVLDELEDGRCWQGEADVVHERVLDSLCFVGDEELSENVDISPDRSGCWHRCIWMEIMLLESRLFVVF